MKKILIPLLTLCFVMAGCSLGLGDAIYQCSVCQTVYFSAYERDHCTKEELCPGRSKKTIETQQEEIEEQKVEIEEQKEEIKEQKVTIAVQQEEIDDLTLERDRLMKEIEEKYKYIAELDAFIAARLDQLGLTEDDIANAQSRYSALAEAIDNIILKKQALENEVANLETKVTELSTTIEAQKETIQKQANQIREKEQEIANLNVEIEVKAKKIAEMDETIGKLTEEIIEQEVLIAQQQIQIAEQETKISEQQIQIAEQAKEILEQEKEIQTQKVKIAELNVEITELNSEIAKQELVIAQKQEKIEEQAVVIKQLSDALASTLNFTSHGYSNAKENVYPKAYMGRGWMSFPTAYGQKDHGFQYIDWSTIDQNNWYQSLLDHGYTPKKPGNYEWTGGRENGYRGYNYYTFYNTLKVGSKNIVFHLTYDTSYEDFSGTSDPIIRTVYGGDRVFNIFTSIVCLDVDQKVWVMKLVDMVNMDNSYYTIIKETGENQFYIAGQYEALTEALDVDWKSASYTLLDYSYLMNAEAMEEFLAK